MIPMVAATLRGFSTKSRLLWTRWSDKRLQTHVFGWTKEVTGNSARRRCVCKDPLLRMLASMLVRLRSNGCAILFPVITEMLVLSEDNTTPRSVALFGI